ncbi:root hair specific 4 [Melia azedarach]|uniref:Root hair specific 4 n=1 Tax=Melia azedarach TaxID=155640 RepID=A0ACC1WUN4_MELAZ|nr:root hair specific 4 [Melia azedarach]
MSFPVSSEEVGYGVDDDDDSNFLTIEEPKSPAKMESPQKEKQILVDPISLREPSFSLMLPLPPVVTSPGDNSVPLPPLLPPAKPNFLSCSLPNSAVSSPRFSSILSKKKWKNESQASPRQVDNLVRQSRLASLQESLFRRSKSCGEGRACAPSDEFDLCLHTPNPNPITEYDKKNRISVASFSKADSNKYIHKKMDYTHDDQEFKCGALCLFLPGFSKSKTVKPRKEEVTAMENVISRTVSLEKFECGSWASSAIINEHDEDGDSMNLYFDLPFELIRNSVNEAHSPINAAFVFDKDLKGVLKNGSSRTTTARKSHESSRHVRFSVSSPTSPASTSSSCITPRLRKAREDFNAFLEAQSA